MEEPINIKLEDSQSIEVVTNAETTGDGDTETTAAGSRTESPCAASTQAHEYFDVILKPTFGYVYSVEKANETLKLFQERSMSRFVCYKVQSSFGRDDWCADNHKILWHQDEQKIKTENYTPMYDGIPYILLGSKLLECQYGIDRNVYQKQKHYSKRNVELLKIKDRRLPVSKKVNCPAKIVMKDIVKFPLFKVDKNTVNGRRIKSMLLRLALRTNSAEGQRRIYIQLPDVADHCNHNRYPIGKRPRRLRKLKDIAKAAFPPSLDTELSDSQFLQIFRVTKSLYQFLVGEWQKEVVEKMVKAGLAVAELEQYEQHVLASLYYLGSTENIAAASSRFKMKPIDLLDTILKFSDLLIRQQEKYLSLPTLEERITIAEVIKHDSGFPGVFGAMDAALIHMRTPLSQEEEYCYAKTASGSKCAFVMQFIVDQRLLFRDIHLDAPGTGTRIQVFQESDAWFHLQTLTSSETHVVAPSVYPLAPAIMTPHVADELSYQEIIYNENHGEALKLVTNVMTIFKSRYKRMQQLDHYVENNRKIVRATCILHNIALMHEAETVMEKLSLGYNSEAADEGWHSVVGDEVVAEFGILGGEEKRHYLTTVMTARYDSTLSYVQLSPHIAS